MATADIYIAIVGPAGAGKSSFVNLTHPSFQANVSNDLSGGECVFFLGVNLI
jgi:putative ribosome biogenesis GTPase RsgA